MSIEHNYIETQSQLLDTVEIMKNCDSLAIDTEFFWERTYYPILGIIQVATRNGEIFIIDAVKIKDLTPLGEIFSNPKIIKILHDAQQDLYIIRRATCADPKNIFDTRFCCGFAGLSSTISLGNMLRELIDVDLPKTESRSDWLKRPLSEKQLLYAENDVRFMHQAYDKIIEKAENFGLSDCMSEDMKALDNSSLYAEKKVEEQYTRIKGYGNFSNEQLAVLREITAWREEYARTRDIPKGFLMKDKDILGIAKIIPKNQDDFRKYQFTNYRFISKNMVNITKKVKKALKSDFSTLCNIDSRISSELKNKTNAILTKIENKCIKMNIDKALIASRKDISNLLNNTPKEKLTKGWRKEFLLDILQD